MTSSSVIVDYEDALSVDAYNENEFNSDDANVDMIEKRSLDDLKKGQCHRVESSMPDQTK